MRYCLDHATTHLAVLFDASQRERQTLAVSDCDSCGVGLQEGSDPLFCTLYLPGQERTEHVLQLDSACAEKLRYSIRVGGELLPDRSAGMGWKLAKTDEWSLIAQARQAT